MPEPPEPTPTEKYTISTLAGTGGTITGNQTIESGQSVSITATAQEHYQLKEWTGDCGTFDKDNPKISFTASKNCQVSAVFEKISPITRDENGIIKIEDGNKEPIGETIIFNEVEYVVVDDELLRSKVNNGENIENVVTTYVEDMSGLFMGDDEIDHDISSWDVSNVTDMSRMFEGNTNFNQDIGHWDVGKVTNMERMFAASESSTSTGNRYQIEVSKATETPSAFNQDIGRWDVGSVTNMKEMFAGATEFNQDIGKWDVSKVTNMRRMFARATKFNQDIGKWDVRKVTHMGEMFAEASSFNQDISRWDISSVSNMYRMFYKAKKFQADLSSWEKYVTSETTDSREMCKMSGIVCSFSHNKTFTISTSSSEGGEISEPQTIDNEDEVVITATPDEGYQLKTWSGDCGDFPPNNSVTFPATKNCSINAEFEKVHAITVSSTDGGTISHDELFSIFYETDDDEVKVTATDNEDSTFKSWAGDCGEFSNDESTITFTVEADSDCMLEVVFEKVSYTITVSSSDGGTISYKVSIVHEQKTSLKATPDTGYQLEELTSDCGTYNKNTNSVSITATEDCSITVAFETDNNSPPVDNSGNVSYTVTTSAGTGGSITESQSKKHGESVSITATPDTGYQIESWSGSCGTFSQSTNPATFTASKSCSISVAFEKISYTITTSAGDGGTITETQSVEHGESVSILAMPDTGYQIESWSGSCGTFSQSTNPATFTASKSCSISVAFEKISYTITTSAGDGGTITETQSVEHGESVNILAMPDTVYQLKEWSGTCGNFEKSVDTATFTATKDCEIGVEFEEKVIYITLLPLTIIDWILPETRRSYRPGDTVEIPVIIGEGYQLIGWEGTCGYFPPVNPVTFPATKDCSIGPIFEKKSYTITTSAGDGGTITETQSVEHGESVSITATPSTGYQIESWSGSCGNFSQSTNPATFTASKSCSISVAFEKISYTITTTAGTGGSITPNQSVKHGESVSITAIPETGYQLKGWTGTCGTFEKSNNTATFTVTKSCAIDASFAQESDTCQKPLYEQNGIIKAKDCARSFIGQRFRLEPSDDTSPMYLIADEQILRGLGNNVQYVNTTFVSDMSRLFSGVRSFNQPLNDWDVSNVTNMTGMFLGAVSFNQPLNNWDVSNVTDMSFMFREADSFNQPLNNWDVSNVTNMASMFSRDESLGSSFNQPLNDWDVSNVTNMGGMFANANSFNQPLNDWDVSNVTNMTGMFLGAVSFNQPLNDWDVSNVTGMLFMFADFSFYSESPELLPRSSFNQPLNDWDVSNVTDMSYMFLGANSFNQDLSGWDVSNVTVMSYMFQGAYSFNQPLNDWDVSNVTNMNGMFQEADSFDQPLNDWDVSSVTDMSYMFFDADKFNQPLNDWDTRKVKDMRFMFAADGNNETPAFNRDLSGWKVANVLDCGGFASNANPDWTRDKHPLFSRC